MKQTTNYFLNKPELTDAPDITVLNPNFDKIDTQLKSLADKDTELNIAINQVKTDYLPLSGGAMTGTIKSSTPNAIQRTTDDAELRILGGTDLTSSYFKLFGKNHASYAGQFSWVATNGANTKYLIGNPNGSLTWDSKNVVRSVNGNYANANGEVNVDFYDYPMINENENLNNYVTDGTYICLLSVIAESLQNAPTRVAFRLDVNPVGAKSAGKFQIVTAYNGDGTWLRHSDSGYWSEWIYMGGREVVRSVNGATVDTNGNVYLPIPTTPQSYVKESSIGTSGYKLYSDGFMICWGSGSVSKDGETTMTFKKAFSTLYGVTSGAIDDGNNSWNYYIKSKSTTNVVFRSCGMVRTVYYMAFGKV